MVVRRLSVNKNRIVDDRDAVGDGIGVMVRRRWFMDALIRSLNGSR